VPILSRPSIQIKHTKNRGKTFMNELLKFSSRLVKRQEKIKQRVLH